MPQGEISRIIDALHILDEQRERYPYTRTPSGGFMPEVIALPTHLWHRLVVALDEYKKFTGTGLASDTLVDGDIDQYARTFGSIARDASSMPYRHDGDEFRPERVRLNTATWHEIVQLCVQHRQSGHEIDQLMSNPPAATNGRRAR